MLLTPPDSRLSATCDWNQPSIGVKNKSAINLHCPCEGLSFHIFPPPSIFDQWHHITDAGRQRLCPLQKNNGRTVERPIQTGGTRCCLLWDDAEPLNEIVTQSRTTTKTILWYLPLIWKQCTSTHDASPQTIPRNPRKRTLSTEVRAPSARISSAPTDGKNDSRLQEFWHVGERGGFYTYWRVKRLTKQRGVVLIQVNPRHVSFKTASNHISISLEAEMYMWYIELTKKVQLWRWKTRHL